MTNFPQRSPLDAQNHGSVEGASRVLGPVRRADLRRDAFTLEEGAYIGAVRSRQRRSGSWYIAPRVMVTRTERDLLEGLHLRWGGGIAPTAAAGPRVEKFAWTLTRKDEVAAFLTAILPHLEGNRERAKLTLELAEMPRLAGSARTRRRLVERRLELWDELKQLNTRERLA